MGARCQESPCPCPPRPPSRPAVLGFAARYPWVLATLVVVALTLGLHLAGAEDPARWIASAYALVVAAWTSVGMVRDLTRGHWGVDILAVTAIVATVLVGEDPASQNYVRMKHKDCEELGIASIMKELPGDCTQDELEQVISELNSDPAVTGSCSAISDGSPTVLRNWLGKMHDNDPAWSSVTGIIQTACTPSCGGATCGADGCGGVCGTCATDMACHSSAQCLYTKGCTIGGVNYERITDAGLLVTSGTTTSAALLAARSALHAGAGRVFLTGLAGETRRNRGAVCPPCRYRGLPR